ncbi:MAG: PaaI family thioesterase [Hyphomicrobiaceae bacterium]
MSSSPRTPGRPRFEPQDPDFADVVARSFGRQGLLQALGASLTDVQPGRVEIAVDYTDRVAQQQGYFHGAVIGAIGDCAGGYAALSLMPTASEVVTVEYKVNFLRPGRGDRLVAIGQVQRAGRSLTVCQMEVGTFTSGEWLETALVQGTFMRVEL